MKIIEAMKKIKELTVKNTDLRAKVALNCANLDFETPMYPQTQKQIEEWMQAHTDINKEILKLRTSIQRTNLNTNVEIEIDGKLITKTIAEWINRRRDLAKSDESMWASLTDRGLKEQKFQANKESPVTEIKIKRYFDPILRDKMIDLYKSEPGIIDRKLEVINATTELV